ncbi:MAG: hypothetical protein ACRC68_07320 [Clostridium sp.]
MKYGIDVNNELLCKRVLDKIKAGGHVIVDLSVEKWSNRGQEVFKKVLLGNITSIDFYLGIEFVENEDNKNEYKLYYSENEYARKHSFNIEKFLKDEVENITCNSGNHLYLIKNMDCPGIYIKIPLNQKVEENIKLIDKLLEELIDIK